MAKHQIVQIFRTAKQKREYEHVHKHLGEMFDIVQELRRCGHRYAKRVKRSNNEGLDRITCDAFGTFVRLTKKADTLVEMMSAVNYD